MNSNVTLPRITVFSLMILCFSHGLSTEQHHAMLEKAIRICLECIGIG